MGEVVRRAAWRATGGGQSSGGICSVGGLHRLEALGCGWGTLVREVGGGNEGREPFSFSRKPKLEDLEAQIPRPPSAEGSVPGPGETSCRRAAGNSLRRAGEEHRLNADAASQHLAGILSASDPSSLP